MITVDRGHIETDQKREFESLLSDDQSRARSGGLSDVEEVVRWQKLIWTLYRELILISCLAALFFHSSTHQDDEQIFRSLLVHMS